MIERDEKGRITKGSLNPGGKSSEDRAAADAIRNMLAAPTFLEAWREGYLNQLVAENPIILKDYADRVAGKAKERVELTGKDGKDLNPLTDISTEELRAWIASKRG